MLSVGLQQADTDAHSESVDISLLTAAVSHVSPLHVCHTPASNNALHTWCIRLSTFDTGLSIYCIIHQLGISLSMQLLQTANHLYGTFHRHVDYEYLFLAKMFEIGSWSPVFPSLCHYTDIYRNFLTLQKISW